MTSPRTPAPLHATPRTKRPTLGPRVTAMAAALGTTLMPWQTRVLDTALELRPDGSFVHPEVLVTVPRQAGKTTIENAWLIDGLEHELDLTSLYFTQSGPAGRTWWRKLGRSLARSTYAAHYRQRMALGDEVITWGPTSSTLAMLPPTESAGHGDSVDRACADEVWRQKDFRLPQALIPAMATRKNRQLWWVSTAGTPESVLLADLLAQGRASSGDPDAPIALFEWGAYAPTEGQDRCECGAEHPVLDPTKRKTWRRAHPAIGHTIDIGTVAHAFATMPLAEFQRAFLNQWTGQREDRQLPLALWLPAQVPTSPLVPGAPLWLAFDLSPGRAGASIAAAGRTDTGVAVELVDYFTEAHRLAPRILELVDRHRPVKVLADNAGPAGPVIDALAERLGDRLQTLNARQYARACQGFQDDLAARTVQVTQAAELDTAASGAVRRVLGDGWAWGRARSAGDISPLVAVTCAAYGARLFEPKAKPRIYARA